MMEVLDKTTQRCNQEQCPAYSDNSYPNIQGPVNYIPTSSVDEKYECTKVRRISKVK